MQLFSEMCNCTYIFAICANFVHNLASCQSHYGRAKARFANSLRAQQKYQNVTTLLWADIHSAHWKPQDMCLDSKKHLFPIQKNINIGAMYISGTRNSWFVCWKCLQNDNEWTGVKRLIPCFTRYIINIMFWGILSGHWPSFDIESQEGDTIANVKILPMLSISLELN